MKITRRKLTISTALNFADPFVGAGAKKRCACTTRDRWRIVERKKRRIRRLPDERGMIGMIFTPWDRRRATFPSLEPCKEARRRRGRKRRNGSKESAYLIAVYPEFKLQPSANVSAAASVPSSPRRSLTIVIVAKISRSSPLLPPARHKETPSSCRGTVARPGDPLQGLPPPRWNFHIQIVLDIERLFQANAGRRRGRRQGTHSSPAV